jgi:hypothetical protein
MKHARGYLSCPGVRIVYFTQGVGSYFGDSSSVAAGIPTVTLHTLKADLALKAIYTNHQGEILRVVSGSTRRADCP